MGLLLELPVLHIGGLARTASKSMLFMQQILLQALVIW